MELETVEAEPKQTLSARVLRHERQACGAARLPSGGKKEHGTGTLLFPPACGKARTRRAKGGQRVVRIESTEKMVRK